MPAYVEPKKYGSDIAVLKKAADESSVIAFRATGVSELINHKIGELLKATLHSRLTLLQRNGSPKNTILEIILMGQTLRLPWKEFTHFMSLQRTLHRQQLEAFVFL